MSFGTQLIGVSLSAVLLTCGATSAVASNPRLVFDFARLAECTEVAPSAEMLLYPGEKLVELKLRVSVHLLAGNIGDVQEVRIEVSDPSNRMRVHDFSPSTQLTSHYRGDIQWSKTTEEKHNLGISLGGELPAPLGTAVAHVTPSFSGETGDCEKITETQVRLAPTFAVVASGTIAQGHGVFFKLRSSPEITLEGTHELTLQFVVPAKWRGDAVRICCQATGTEKVLWMRQQTTWASTCSELALYLSGDLQARQAAIRFVDGKQRG